MNFDFVQDPRFKELLIRDYQELKNCLNNHSAKSALILCGSIIEAVLVEYFISNQPQGFTEAQILKLSLGSLIDLSEKEKLLSSSNKNLASVIQDYRNLIHPGRQIRIKEDYDLDKATIANSLLNIILKEISVKAQSVYNISSSEIIEGLKAQHRYRTIFGKVIPKLNLHERNKLVDELLNYDMEEKSVWEEFNSGSSYKPTYHELQNIKPLFNELKPLIGAEKQKSLLHNLVTSTHKGETLKAYCLYNLMHEDLDKLAPDEQETIAIFMLSFFESIHDSTMELAQDKTLSTIGKYIHTSEGEQAFINFTKYCIVHFDKKFIINEMEVYEQAFNSLPEVIQTKIREAIMEFLKNGPPKDIEEGFVASAKQKGIIS